jgi:hypothetical protein
MGLESQALVRRLHQPHGGGCYTSAGLSLSRAARDLCLTITLRDQLYESASRSGA